VEKMINKYFHKRKSQVEKIVGLALVVVGVILILIYTPLWLWMAILGLVLIATGWFIGCGWR